MPKTRINWRVAITIFLSGLFLVLSTGFASQRGADQPTNSGPRISFIKKTEGFLDAGCDFQQPADFRAKRKQYIFLTDFEDNAVMNIDGEDVRLRQVSHRERKVDLKKGSRYTETYTGKGVDVRVDYLATWVCPPDDESESCEITLYDATITVTRRESRTAIRVKGICGT